MTWSIGSFLFYAHKKVTLDTGDFNQNNNLPKNFQTFGFEIVLRYLFEKFSSFGTLFLLKIEQFYNSSSAHKKFTILSENCLT